MKPPTHLPSDATVFYLLRHAPALAPGFSNRERPLTPDGWQQARALARDHRGQTLLLCTHGGCLWGVLKHFAEDSLFADYGHITSPDLKRIVWGDNPYFDLDFDSKWTARTHVEGNPAFGRLHALYDYRSRPGGYALVRDKENRIAVVSAPGGLYLPGGGIDAGESPAAATKREFLEECGLGVNLDLPLGQAHQYVYSTAEETAYRKECFYFTGHLNGLSRPPSEADHSLLWLPPEQAAEKLVHAAHSWAVRRLLDNA